MKSKLNSAIVAMILSGFTLASLSVSAKNELPEQHLNNVKRDIKVMSTILQTTLKDKLGRNSGQVSASYLAHQGMLFEISANNRFAAPNIFISKNGNVFSSNSDSAFVPPPPPKPGTPSTSKLERDLEELVEIRMETENTEHFFEMSHSDIEDIEFEIHKATMLAESLGGDNIKARKEMREAKNELRKKQRELSKQASKLERKARQVEREIRDAELVSDINNGESDQQIKKLEAEMQGLKTQLKNINNEMVKHQKTVREAAQKAKEQVRKQQQELAKTYAFTISELVCDFGSGLKSLKEDKFMTFYVNDASQLYYVFKQDDIEKCNKGKINYRALLDSAVKYSL
ncbi:hypothetical protein [Psychrosphaera aestuarii]|uniref:hypothetical protein n=1 Tax=Psychrosphaera aestuarii TaxID=1266052 RepID=UPI001B32C7A9|nr:hypothetical protein [Psychrosphaera aestuarii]